MERKGGFIVFNYQEIIKIYKKISKAAVLFHKNWSSTDKKFETKRKPT